MKIIESMEKLGLQALLAVFLETIARIPGSFHPARALCKE